MLGNVQTVDEVYYTDLATKLTRSKYDVIVFPDGSGHQQRKAIGEAGTAAVKKFVLNGGGYLGICAGAFSAIDAYGFLPDRKYVPGSQMRGKGRVNVEFTRSIVDEFGLTPADYKNASVAYANGPVLDAKSLPKSVSVLASFRTAPSHIAKEPQGKVMINQPAAVRTTFGKGRVVLFSPNFELGIHAKLFAGVVGWLSGLA